MILDFITEKLNRLREQGLYRELQVLDGEQATSMSLNGKQVLLFCANDYLGLAAHPSLKRAARNAIDRFGCGAAASRLISGTMALHESLEKKIALFKKKEAALLFNSGFTVNLGIFSTLLGRGDLIFSDKLNHASILNGAKLSNATLKRYPHKDMKGLESLLRASKPSVKKIIVTDGLFSMDGDLAPLPDIVHIADKYDAWVMVDDAHGTGVFGENGRGTAEHFGVEERINIHMGTLSKAVGSLGGFIAGSRELRDLLINRAGSLIYTTSLPPPVLAASNAGLDIIRTNPSLRRSLLEKAYYFRSSIKRLGFDTMESESQIIPILIGDADLALQANRLLLEKGVLIPAIRPPTVPEGKARLRISVSAAHSWQELEKGIRVLAEVGKKLGII